MHSKYMPVIPVEVVRLRRVANPASATKQAQGNPGL